MQATTRESSEGNSNRCPTERWYALEVTEVAKRLGTCLAAGLTTAEVDSRRKTEGFNRLVAQHRRSHWSLFFSQFKSALIIILIGAAALAAFIGNHKDAIVILTVVVINALVGFYQERRAEQSTAALRKMLPRRTHVRRDGEKIDIEVEHLVLGDLVLLEAGESQPSSKQDRLLQTIYLPLADRVNMAYMNTMVARGRAELIVTATGMQTEIGQLSQQLAETADTPSPLQVQLDKLGKRLGA